MPIFATKPVLGQPRAAVYSKYSHPLQFVKQVDNNAKLFLGTRIPKTATTGVPSVLTDQEGVEIAVLPGDETGRSGAVITVPPCRAVTTLIVRLPSTDTEVRHGGNSSPVRYLK